MSEAQVFWLCILLGMLGLAVVGGIAWLGYGLFRLRIAGRFFDHPFLEEMFHRWMKGARFLTMTFLAIWQTVFLSTCSVETSSGTPMARFSWPFLL